MVRKMLWPLDMVGIVESHPAEVRPPIVLVAHPEGSVHELAKAALAARWTLRFARTQSAALTIAATYNVAVAIVSGADGTEAADFASALRTLRPATRVLFLLNRTRSTTPWGLCTIGTVLPATIDAERLRASVERAWALARASTSRDGLRRDSDLLFRAIRAIAEARRRDPGLGWTPASQAGRGDPESP